MKKQKYTNIEIPEELSIPRFKERYSKMILSDAKQNLFVELRNWDGKLSLMKKNDPYWDATVKMVKFMKELTCLMGSHYRPASAGDLGFNELKSLFQQICDNSNILMPTIQGDDEEC